jgi:hypothetical protein
MFLRPATEFVDRRTGIAAEQTARSHERLVKPLENAPGLIGNNRWRSAARAANTMMLGATSIEEIRRRVDSTLPPTCVPTSERDTAPGCCSTLPH